MGSLNQGEFGLVGAANYGTFKTTCKEPSDDYSAFLVFLRGGDAGVAVVEADSPGHLASVSKKHDFTRKGLAYLMLCQRLGMFLLTLRLVGDLYIFQRRAQ